MSSSRRAFLPTLVANALPLVGIALLDWRVAEVLAVYWLELATAFLAYGAAALFAARPVVLEGREAFFLPAVGRNTERAPKWECEPSPVDVPGPLPPIYPRNGRLVAATLFWGFGLLAVPLIAAPEAVDAALSLPLLGTTATMLGAHVLDLRREFFDEGQYEERSAHTVLEVPGRLLAFASIYVALAAAVGGGGLLFILALLYEAGVTVPDSDAGVLFGASMIAGKLLAEWGRFDAARADEPGWLGTWFQPEKPEA
ncbi:hypothetical protein JCM30237_11560 [Halolamina litorea]|uniref:DUF6498-containing protein n=1 Tax=Halolamina litorea TaxID=1515593 RepID=A0ABD6BLR6_9EURY|nr:DUF6498-containing protein [Halolamina litorea]